LELKTPTTLINLYHVETLYLLHTLLVSNIMIITNTNRKLVAYTNRTVK
jgi:hypothetical protein